MYTIVKKEKENCIRGQVHRHPTIYKYALLNLGFKKEFKKKQYSSGVWIHLNH